MATGVSSWSTTASNNGTADSNVNWAEGMAPSAVNDSARSTMASVAKWRDDLSGTMITAGGSSSAYTASSNQGIASLIDGFTVAFVANHTNTGAATLAVDGLTAKPLRVATGAATPAGAIVSGSIYTASYEAGNDEWLLHGFFGDQTETPGVGKLYFGSTAPSGWLLCQGQAISRTTYAALFAIISTTYGIGDGSTTFNLPDMGGRVPAGKEATATRLTTADGGVDGDTLGAVGGSQSITLDATMIPSHTHTFTGSELPTHSHTSPIHAENAAIGAGGTSVVFGGSTLATTAVSAGTPAGTNDNTGGGLAHKNVQPTIVVNYIIKT